MEIIAHYKSASSMKVLWLQSISAAFVILPCLILIVLSLWWHFYLNLAMNIFILVIALPRCVLSWRLLRRVAFKKPAIWIQDDELVYAAQTDVRVKLSDITDYKVRVLRLTPPSKPLGVNLRLRNSKQIFIPFDLLATNDGIVRLLRRLTADKSQRPVLSGA